MLISKTKTEQKRNDGSSTIVFFKRLARHVKQIPEKRQCDDGQWYTKEQFDQYFQKQADKKWKTSERLSGQKVCREIQNKDTKYLEELMNNGFRFGPISIARIANILSKNKSKDIDSLTKYLNYIVRQGILEEQLNAFEPQHLAMLANGASKCGTELCQEIMTKLIGQIDGEKFNAMDIAMLVNGCLLYTSDAADE